MDLSASELRSISRLLDEGLGIDIDAREAWLDALPARDAPLIPLLRQMLERAQTSSGLLIDRLPRLGEEVLGREKNSTLDAGQRVGPYELVRELGSGGMAEVWLARRADGAYRREVALKLPKLPRLRPHLERHYERERDILARLEHPYIARLYDAGVAADGLPYLAMEYVQGQPLTAWCDARRLGLRERLTLLLQAIEAVRFAHDQQVIHRDLKPSNVYVTAAGQVRLLDFGIAKLLDDATADGVAEHLYTRALTPDYASPELLRGEAVDSRTDVYSLGAVLFELLTGDRPYRLTFVDPSAQLAQALERRRVATPSEAVVAGAGRARATTDDRLAGRLQGELDAITRKALAPKLTDRYPSVTAFADDLHRYLNSEPVLALPERMTRDDLVAQLARNPNVRVRQRIAATHRPSGGTPLSASIATPGRRMRIVAELTDAASATRQWSRTYEVTLRSGSNVVDELATTVLEAMRGALNHEAPAGGWRLSVELTEDKKK